MLHKIPLGILVCADRPIDKHDRECNLAQLARRAREFVIRRTLRAALLPFFPR